MSPRWDSRGGGDGGAHNVYDFCYQPDTRSMKKKKKKKKKKRDETLIFNLLIYEPKNLI